MNAKHTPGPWHLDQYGHVYGWKQVDSTTTKSVPLLDGRYSEANVYDKLLIAAAPDLLAALEAICSDHDFCGDEWGNRRDAWIETARAAIAKAT